MDEIIRVYNDDGEEAEFYVLEQTQINGNTYLLATETDGYAYDDEDEEVGAWIFKQVKTGTDDIYYETIDDENELEAVTGVFAELLDDFDIEL